MVGDVRNLIPDGKRILVVTGHYGSGKTEFSVSLALLLAAARIPRYPRLALVDLDIANPYFRSRERRNLLEQAGVHVYGSFYDSEITAELPALSAEIRTPLEDPGCFTIVDVGGNDSGARVLNQFRKYFTSEENLIVSVVNANRFETRDPAGIQLHLAAIEAETKLSVRALINNTHLLRETTAETIRAGHALCMEVCRKTGKQLLCDCFPAPLIDADVLADLNGSLMPVGMHMRESWLDK